MNKVLIVLLASLALTACNNSSSDKKEEPQELPGIVETLETSKIKLQFNLPIGSGILDTQNFSIDNPLTYNTSTSTFVCLPSGEQELLYFYFVNTESEKWDVYFRLADDLLDIEGGELGGTGQIKASLEFDDEGLFIRQIPYIIETIELQYPEKEYKIEFDFYSSATTSLDEPFNVKNLEENGCE